MKMLYQEFKCLLFAAHCFHFAGCNAIRTYQGYVQPFVVDEHAPKAWWPEPGLRQFQNFSAQNDIVLTDIGCNESQTLLVLAGNYLQIADCALARNAAIICYLKLGWALCHIGDQIQICEYAWINKAMRGSSVK